MTQTEKNPDAQSIPEAVQKLTIPESAHKYGHFSKADLFDLVQKLEEENKALLADRTLATERYVDSNNTLRSVRTELITAKSKIDEMEGLLKRADSLISQSHCADHETRGKLEAYENIIGLMVTGKPGMGERDKSPELGPLPESIQAILAKIYPKKTGH